MSRYIHEKVVDGLMTRSWAETVKGQGKVIRVYVFANEEGTGEPVGDWDMPFLPDYDGMATTAARQTIAKMGRKEGGGA